MPRFTIHDLAATIDARAASGGEASYTRKLLDKGAEHCAKKLGEEAVETVIAAVENDRDHLIAESADLLFHLLVLLKARGVKLEEVEAALAQRTSMSGLEEKASRKRDCGERWEIFTHGGRNSTGIDAIEYAQEVVSLGAGEILLTSMDRDGTRQGFDLPLTQAIADSVPVPVIASGGVGNLDHLVDGIRQGHATAVLAASIFHFGEFTIRQAKEHMVRAGLPMRLDPYDSPSQKC